MKEATLCECGRSARAARPVRTARSHNNLETAFKRFCYLLLSVGNTAISRPGYYNALGTVGLRVENKLAIELAGCVQHVDFRKRGK